jgi:predicted RNase H-like nuclease (RuvC/YqgF family)
VEADPGVRQADLRAVVARKELEEETEKLRQGLKELRDEIHETNRKLDLLAVVVQRLDLRLEHERETAARDRENLILRFERRLPPGSPQDDQDAL